MLQETNPLNWDEPIPEELTPIGEPARETGFLENFGAARDEQGLVRSPAVNRNLREAYDPIVEALNDGMAAADRFRNPANIDDGASVRFGYRTRAQEEQRLWAELARRQSRGDLTGLPRNVDEFRRRHQERMSAELQRARAPQQNATGWGQVGGFAGSMFGTFRHDPVALGTLPFGGWGRTILGRIGSEAFVSGAVTAVEQPDIGLNYRNLGVDYGLDDAAGSILIATLGGAVVRGGFEGARPAGRILGRAYDRAVEGAFNAVPETVQRRWADAGTIDGRRITEGFRATAPEIDWTPDQRAAVSLIERNAEIREASPFVADVAGDAEHAARLNGALQRHTDDRPPAAVERRPAPRGTVSGAAAGEALKARIRRVESGGNDRARNPRSSAAGRYQFTDATFRTVYRRLYGTQLPPNVPDSVRLNPVVQERLMDALVVHNRAALRRNGYEENVGNLYLLHFAGDGDGLALLRAPPETPAIRILGARVIEANPHLRGRTAGDVIAWAHRAMGGEAAPAARLAGGEAPPARSFEEPGVRRAAEPADDWRDALERLQDEATDEAPAVFAEPMPVLRRDLFANEEDWAAAQRSFEEEGADEIAAPADANVEPAREVVAGGPEGPAAAIAPVRASEEPATAADLRRAIEAHQVAETKTGAAPGTARYLPPPETYRLAAATDGPRLRDFISEQLGTPDWAVAPRLTKGLKAKGADLAVPQARYRELAAEWEDEVLARAGEAEAPRGQGDPALEAFDEPGGAGRDAQIESLEHDLVADLAADPELSGRLFRLEEEGAPRPLQDILEEMDAESGFAAALRGCL